uniref:GDNF/GAS1 domain-containing protein n=1 Tax=Panagrolaimus sp. JU765 TaxID=591449 RepID=A0AC34RJ50_9BILA
MRCSADTSCVRQQCASALRRFSRYVSKELAEAVTFCQCAPADAECKEFQHLMYPRCLYNHFKEKPDHNCKDTVQSCRNDSYCNRRLPVFNSSCSVTSGGICDSGNLSKCREVMLTIRGTPLESPCYCSDSDSTCLYEQTLLLPNNPCVEVAMEDYAKQHAKDYFFDPDHSSTENPVKSVEEVKNEIQTLRNQTASKVETSRLSVESLLSNSTDNDVVFDAAERKKVKVPKLTQKETVQMKSSSNKLKQSITPDFETIANSTESLKTTTKPYKKKNLHTYPTDTYVTQAPPKEGGCVARNIDGSWITHYKNSVIRQYNDWSGRCSSWCECSDEEKLTCQELPCLEDGKCQTEQTQMLFGEKLYIDERGACICHSGEFICDTVADFPEELDPGLYISIGYSLSELKLFKEKVPKKFREKSGLVSPDSSIVKDIVSRLQFALERVMPKDTLCRIIILDELTHDDNVVLQVQWYGVDVYTNITEPQWHVGKMEKICAPYLKRLEYTFLLEKADRYQLVLSAVKQIRVYDLLDGLPPINTAYSLKRFHFQLIFVLTIVFLKV